MIKSDTAEEEDQHESVAEAARDEAEGKVSKKADGKASDISPSFKEAKRVVQMNLGKIAGGNTTEAVAARTRTSYFTMVRCASNKDDLMEIFDVARQWETLSKTTNGEHLKPLTISALGYLRRKCIDTDCPEFGLYVLLRHEEIGMQASVPIQRAVSRGMQSKLARLADQTFKVSEYPGYYYNKSRTEVQEEKNTEVAAQEGEEREASLEAQTRLLDYLLALSSAKPSRLQSVIEFDLINLVQIIHCIIHSYGFLFRPTGDDPFLLDEVIPRLHLALQVFIESAGNHIRLGENPDLGGFLSPGFLKSYVKVNGFKVGEEDKAKVLLDLLEELTKDTQ
ncbi:hypothetical protein CBS101457_002767 [Exobasidium rhododendri]|nr:hypothetical protein CBS101457_002767 [Exobasidium rhododendri]